VAGATRGIDVDEAVLITEAYTVARFTYGGFSYNDLREMPFTEYVKLVAKVREDIDGSQG
jgi:hypothetical protein